MIIIEEPGTPLRDLALISIVPYPKWKFVSKQAKLYVNEVDYDIRIGVVFVGDRSDKIWTLSGLYCRGWVFTLEQHLNESDKEVRLVGIKDNFYGVFKIYRNVDLCNNRTLWRTILNRYVAENFLQRLIPEFTYELGCHLQAQNVPGSELSINGGILDETERYDYLHELRQFRAQSQITWPA